MKLIYRPILMLLPFLFACSDEAIAPNSDLNASIDGKTIEILENQQFTLLLDLHADAGYSWNCSISDLGIVALDSVSYKPKDNDPDLLGGLTIQTFYFTGIHRGICKISLIEHQSWDTEAEPLNSIHFYVRVE